MSVAAADETPTPAETAKKHDIRPLIQMLFVSVWAVGSLFLSAGTWRWTRGWICVALWLTAMPAVGLITNRYNPGLLSERAKWSRKDTKGFDKIFFAVYLPIVLLQPALGGLDAVRYHWSSLSFGWVYPGIVIYLLSMSLIAWVFATNPHAESSVRIQTDRGHRVITNGPYRYVRHPMYVGSILMYFGTPLIWGSVWALVLAAIAGLLFIARTALEDTTLRRELPGYEEYAARSRYRLVPGVW
jgi:protein-S-isoprenylcysteine O-methyltransferase Ste14